VFLSPFGVVAAKNRQSAVQVFTSSIVGFYTARLHIHTKGDLQFLSKFGILQDFNVTSGGWYEKICNSS